MDGGFGFKDIGNAFNKVISNPAVTKIAEQAANKAANAAIQYAMGSGRPHHRMVHHRAPVRKAPARRGGAVVRGALVKRIMAQRGVSLPIASQIVKHEGLY
jgi:hypothetical protein